MEEKRKRLKEEEVAQLMTRVLDAFPPWVGAAYRGERLQLGPRREPLEQPPGWSGDPTQPLLHLDAPSAPDEAAGQAHSCCEGEHAAQCRGV